jgi:pyruvate dehydrogenase E2 component (dihydrolipoamide acetyltransferase)
LKMKVPDIGDFDEVAVIELMVKVGDTVKAEQSLITVESDKASMEIPSSHAGVVKELKVAMGDKVKQGSLVLMLEVAGEAAAPASACLNRKMWPQRLLHLHRQLHLLWAPPSPKASPLRPWQRAAPVFVRVPDIGDFKDVAVIEVFVKVGDTVKVEQSADHRRERQSVDGNPVAPRGRAQGAQGQAGRHRQHRRPCWPCWKVLRVPLRQPPLPALLLRLHRLPLPLPQLQRLPHPWPATAALSWPCPPTTRPLWPLGCPTPSPSVRKFARELGVPLD